MDSFSGLNLVLIIVYIYIYRNCIYLLVCTVNTAYIPFTFFTLSHVSGIMLSSLVCTVNILCLCLSACLFGVNGNIIVYVYSRLLHYYALVLCIHDCFE